MHGCPTPAIPDLVDLLTDDIAEANGCIADQPELLVMPGGKGEARHQELKGIICQRLIARATFCHPCIYLLLILNL